MGARHSRRPVRGRPAPDPREHGELRAGDDRVLLALGRERDTLQRLRDDSRVAFCLLGEGVAFTAYGYASVVLGRATRRRASAWWPWSYGFERVQDHLADGRTEMLDGARWRWRDEVFGAAEERIVREAEGL